jgi:hypothetical protein
MKHTMDNTPRIITILGLVLEGVGVLGLYMMIYMISILTKSSYFTFEKLEITQEEFNDLLHVVDIVEIGFIVLAIFMTIVFVINLYLFTNLIKGKYTEQQAKGIYLYQSIWGGISLLYNTLVGILYLVSGIQGYKGRKEEKNIREGI